MHIVYALLHGVNLWPGPLVNVLKDVSKIITLLVADLMNNSLTLYEDNERLDINAAFLTYTT